MIETKEIKMPPKKMLSILFLNYGSLWSALAFGGFAVWIILGFTVSLKFFFLALIWIFLLVPLVVAFLYFFYGMEPLTAFNSIPHKIEFSPDQLILKFISQNPDDIDGQEEQTIEKKYIVKKSDYIKMKSGADYILLFFKPKSWLWLPVEAFNNMDDFKEAISMFPNNS